MQKKYKILALTDSPVGASGVGTQAQFLFRGLVATGKYSFRVLGAAVKHSNYNVVNLGPDFIIKPIDGFGTREQLRQLLITEKPDALFLFTDPRQFIWVWEVEDEVRQVCPIVYWHVWDNDPTPTFNNVWYESTDLINCLSYKTYEMVKQNFPEKTNYIPHAFPKQVIFPLPENQVKYLRQQYFGNLSDHFICLWVNRNAHRKMPSHLLDSWKLFLDNLEAKHGHRKALLVLHCNPTDPEGPNLFAVVNELGIKQNVFFSPDVVSFPQLNELNNAVDCVVNISKAEGFGLNILTGMQVGKPAIALKTGGLTRQVVDYRTGDEMGVALDPVERVKIGGQLVPFIYEDIVAKKDVADAFMKVYELTPEQKEELKAKLFGYVDHEFNHEAVVKAWDETLENTIKNFKPKRWDLVALGGAQEQVTLPPQGK